MFLSVLLPLKYVWMPYLPQVFLMLFHKPCMYGITMYPLDVLLLLSLLLFFLLLGSSGYFVLSVTI